MLKLGEKIISDLYLGDKRIAKAFLGDKLVYKAREPIFVEYIEFDGASWIDTDISYQDCTVECGLTCPATSDRKLMGWASNAGTYWGITNGQFELGGGFVLTESDTTKYSEVKIEVTISDKRYVTLSHAGNSVNREGNIGTGTYNYTIGALPNTYSYGFTGNLYFHKFISPDGVLIQDLRPCIHPNGTVCFYDMVTKKYFYNQGTGTLKSSGRFVKSILFDGASYIDTGIAHQTCTVKTRIRFEKTSVRQYMGFSFGNAHYWGSNASNLLSVGSQSLTTAQADATVMNDVTIEYNTDDISAPTETLIVNGNSITVTGNNVLDNTYKIGTSNKSYVVTAEVESNAIYIAGELIQDLRPYVDEDGIPCFYDTVTNVKFYNNGTGTLSYTE